MLISLSFLFLGTHHTDVNVAIRKIANLLKTDKDISVDGDHMVIKTLSTFKNYNMDFHVGKEFEEDLSGVDDRKCMVSLLYIQTTFLFGQNIFLDIDCMRTKSKCDVSV